MKKKITAAMVGEFIGGLILGAVLCALGGFILMIAWNYVSPALFHGPTIPFGPAYAIIGLFTFILRLIKQKN